MSYITPPINLKGTFKLKAPLNTLINENVIYTVDSIKSISSYLNDNINIETFIYINNGLTSEDYHLALKEKIPIVTIKSEGNALVNIPADYFIYMPQITGKIFRNKAIIINLGYVPVEDDVSYLEEEVNDYIINLTGYECSTTSDALSGDYIVSFSEYDVFESQRIDRQNVKNTCRGLLTTANETIASYKNKVALLIDKINLMTK